MKEGLNFIATVRFVGSRTLAITVPKKFEKFGIKNGQEWHVILDRCILDVEPDVSDTGTLPPHEKPRFHPTQAISPRDEPAEFHDRYEEDNDKFYV